MSRDIPGTGGNYLSVGDVAALDITGTALTLAAWVNADTYPNANPTIIGKLASSGTTVQYGLLLDGSGHINVFVGDAGGFDNAAGATVVGTGAWHHLAGVKNGTGAGALLAYLDGAQDASITSNRSIQNTAHSFTVGARTDNSFHFDGRIAEVCIWDAALTAAEIAALAKGVSPLRIRPGNLKGHFPLWAAAYPEADLSGNANNLAQNGTVNGANHAPLGHYV